eukprot:CAMPEP_0116975502 /NCGR_PEP_ID=MMETSP0467-20121206/55848_1 /TAXON_ID=283647 /ORGANISM="Mesodinium pulex, Strain SPMC105" /LENGTH=48 /DNA_ID= /DNA_START= /DNA_END= /DNA_ORIENTATION=
MPFTLKSITIKETDDLEDKNKINHNFIKDKEEDKDMPKDNENKAMEDW